MTKKLTADDKQKRDDAKVFFWLEEVQDAFSKLEKHYDKINVIDLKSLEEVR